MEPLSSLNEGQALEFELVSSKGKTSVGEFGGSLIMPNMSGMRLEGGFCRPFIFESDKLPLLRKISFEEVRNGRWAI